MAWELGFYETPAGTRPAQDFLDGLIGAARREAIAGLRLLATDGAAVRLPHSRALGDGLFELRGRASGVRLFYMFRPGRRIVVLDGVIKKRDELPAAVLRRVRRLQHDVEDL